MKEPAMNATTTLTITRDEITDAAELIDLYEADDQSDEGFSIREEYSGRGMFGTTCAGIDLDSDEVLPFVAALTALLTERDRLGDALSLASKARTDSMGSDVVLYWPGVTITD
jgi:hypothetical protein